jgi:hypothetical protein
MRQHLWNEGRCRLWLGVMLVVPTVVRRRSVRKDKIVCNIVMSDPADIEGGWIESSKNRRRTRAQIA